MNGTREGEGEAEGKIQLDPFVQPPVLKAFFNQLPVKELAKCRLVSKLWCSESLSAWRSTATLRFGSEGIASTRDDGSRSINISIGEFLDLWEAGDWGSCPFRKFIIDWWDFEAEDQQRFLKLVGGHVTLLVLRMCSFDGIESFQRIIYQAFPNLRFLNMDNYCLKNGPRRFDSEEEDELEDILEYKPTNEIPPYKEPAFGVHGLKALYLADLFPFDSVMDMLSHFHKIEGLHMEILDPRKYRKLLEAIRLIRAQNRWKLPLKEFDVKFIFEFGKRTAAGIELLKLHEQLKLPLQRLHILLYPEADLDSKFNNVISDILQHHSSTLTHLNFDGEDRHELCKSLPFGFTLEKLEELVIPSPRFSDNLNFLRYTPNLHVLCVESGYENPVDMSESDELFSKSEELEIGDWTLPSLTDLTFPLPLSPRNLGKLMKWMPNVEKLYGLELDDVKFSMVCNTWKHLKVLSDYGTEITDQGVIGTEDAHAASGDGETRSGSNITKLKKLTSFYTSSSKLTSASVRDGFLKLAHLTKIVLGQSTEIDKEAKAALGKRKIEFKIKKHYH